MSTIVAASIRRVCEANAACLHRAAPCFPGPGSFLQAAPVLSHGKGLRGLALRIQRKSYAGSMAEDKGKSTDDELVISLEHEWERHNWAQWLHCSEKEL